MRLEPAQGCEAWTDPVAPDKGVRSGGGRVLGGAGTAQGIERPRYECGSHTAGSGAWAIQAEVCSNV